MLRLLALSWFAWAAGAASAAPRTVLVFGDSLSAGFGIAAAQAWPALLNRQLAEANRYAVVNASIRGEPSAGGRARLPRALAEFRPAVVVLALGANDGLRGLPPAQLQDNLVQMVRDARKAGARVLLVGMRLPPNYGAEYNTAFEAAFAHAARRERVPLLPFLLEPIAADATAFQADRLHPVADVQGRLRDHVHRALRPLLE